MQEVKVEGKVVQEREGNLTGENLKTNQNVSFLGDVDLNTGRIVAKDSDIEGENISGKIFLFPGSRGSTVGANVLFGLAKKNLAPMLLVTKHPEMITMSGAIFGNIPMIVIEEEAFDQFKTGNKVKAFIEKEKGYLVHQKS